VELQTDSDNRKDRLMIEAAPMEINWHRALRLWALASVVWCAAVAAYVAFAPAPSPTTVHIRFSDHETWDYPSEWGEIRIRQDLDRRVAALHAAELEEVARMPEARKAECHAIPKNVPFADQPSDCVKLFFSGDPLAVPEGWEYQIPKPPWSIWQGSLLAIGPPLFMLVLLGAIGKQKPKHDAA
jgi:hypothetical protein